MGGEAPLPLAFKHWRSLLTVVLPEQDLTHFRFYSPTVLRTIAESCTPQELAWLLGPFAHIFIPLATRTLRPRKDRAGCA